MNKTEQEAWDQDTIVLRHLLTLDPRRTYTVADLADNDILDRALRLLFRARFGQDREYVRISPYIRYDKLSRRVAETIDKNCRITDKEIRRLRKIAAASGSPSTRYVSSRSIWSSVSNTTCIA